MFSDLECRLGELRATPFVYVPNPGNAGDALIAHATYQLFDRMGLDYEVGNELGKYPGRIVVWGGGGNFVEPYINLRNFLLANGPYYERLIVLPHTFRAYPETLATLGSNCEIFCRDLPSLDFVRKHAPRAASHLSHDLAFGLDVDATFATRFPLPLLSSREMARRNVKRLLRTVPYRLRTGTLNCFREDAEATGQAIHPNIDVSAVYATGIMSPKFALESTYRMMRFIGSFEAINTNRLHIGILAAVLGKRVNLFDNNYGKNRAIFEHSMGRFDNVVWAS